MADHDHEEDPDAVVSAAGRLVLQGFDKPRRASPMIRSESCWESADPVTFEVVGGQITTEELLANLRGPTGDTVPVLPAICSANFPMRYQESGRRTVVFLSFDHPADYDQARGEADHRCLAMPEHEDALLFAAASPNTPEGMIIFPHEPWQDPVSRVSSVIALVRYASFSTVGLHAIHCSIPGYFKFAFLRPH